MTSPPAYEMLKRTIGYRPVSPTAKAGRFKALPAHLNWLANFEGRSGFPLSQRKVKTDIDELNNRFVA
jgi:hypothetical protein